MSVATYASPLYGAIFQTSPIYLTGGLYNNIINQAITDTTGSDFQVPGIPISVFTEVSTLVFGTLTNEPITQSFCNFRPLPGSTLLKYQVAEYPFYTQQIAANASIKQPNAISMLMFAPAGGNTPLVAKMAIMTALQTALDNHIQSGGTFTVMTPSFIYEDCLLTGLTDVSGDSTLQVQWAYQWDFVQPLLTFPSASGIQNALTSTLTNGGVTP